MNEDVRLPIKTVRESNKITKVCVEDVYKIINRIYKNMNKAYNDSVDVLESIHKDVNDWEGELIVGTGISQPCMTDAFDEEIGNNIAFMKAKLNANIKKHNFICRVYNNFSRACYEIEKELFKIDGFILDDLERLRTYNENYLPNIENKLGL